MRWQVIIHFEQIRIHFEQIRIHLEQILIHLGQIIIHLELRLSFSRDPEIAIHLFDKRRILLALQPLLMP